MIDENSDSRFNQAILENNGIKTIQFETLLWGGDEMLFVLPAWLGFEFIHYFFEQTKDWDLGEPMTHAAGIVFCSAKTPIKHIQNLAKSLADTLKEIQPEESPNNKSGRDQNAWNYIVLESIDYPSNSHIEDFNTKHYGKLAETRPKFIPASINWDEQEQRLQPLIHQELIPRRQLYRLVQAITSPQAKDEESTLSWKTLNEKITIENATLQEKQELRLIEVSEHKAELLDNLPIVAKQVFSLDIEMPQQRVWLWIYLYELWDYICPQMTSQK